MSRRRSTDYTFTAADLGSYTFSVTLLSGGAQSLAFTDTATSSIQGSDSVTVTKGSTTSTLIAAPNPSTYGQSVTLTATVNPQQVIATITDDDPQPTFAINDVAIAEGDAGPTLFTFTVTKSGPTALTAMVTAASADGTATIADSDYATLAPTVLTFAPADITQTVSVNVNGDTAIESNETFDVNLSGASNTTISDPTGTGTITNDDGAIADLAITKTVASPGPYSVGQNLTYNITVTNNGPSTGTGVIVTDTLPPETSFVSATPSQGSCTGTTTVICNLGTLSNAGTATIALTVQLDAAGTITNTANASSDVSDPTPASRSATITAAANGSGIPTLSEWMLIALASLTCSRRSDEAARLTTRRPCQRYFSLMRDSSQSAQQTDRPD